MNYTYKDLRRSDISRHPQKSSQLSPVSLVLTLTIPVTATHSIPSPRHRCPLQGRIMSYYPSRAVFPVRTSRSPGVLSASTIGDKDRVVTCSERPTVRGGGILIWLTWNQKWESTLIKTHIQLTISRVPMENESSHGKVMEHEKLAKSHGIL